MTMRALDVTADEQGVPLDVSGDAGAPTNTPPAPAAEEADTAAEIAEAVAAAVATQVGEAIATAMANIQAQQAPPAQTPPRRAPSGTPPPADASAGEGDDPGDVQAAGRVPQKPIPAGGTPARPVKYDSVAEVSAAWHEAAEPVKDILQNRGSSHIIDFRVEPRAIRADTLYEDIEVGAATLVDVGPVQVRDRTRVAVTPIPRAIDYMPMRPVVGNSVVVPVMQDATAPGGGASGSAAAQAVVRLLQSLSQGVELTIDVPAYIYPIQNLIINHPVSKAIIEDDPTIVGAEVRRLLRLSMQVLDSQVLGGTASIDFATGNITAGAGVRNKDLVGLSTLSGDRSEEVPAWSGGTDPTAWTDAQRGDNQRANNMLDAPKVGVESIVSDILARDYPTLGIFPGDVWQKLWSSLRATFYPMAGMTQRQIDYMGVSYVLDALGPANVGYVGAFVEENQYIGMRRDVRVEMSDDYQFGDDNMTFKATLRAANCIANPNSFLEITNTDRYLVKTPLVTTG